MRIIVQLMRIHDKKMKMDMMILFEQMGMNVKYIVEMEILMRQMMME